MNRGDLTTYCMVATPFTDDGALDEDGLRRQLARMVDAGLAVYVGGGGAAEGHALTEDEIDRIYEIGLEECKGRVPTCANPPECRTADAMYERARRAADAGIELVQLYPVDGGHGMVPTEAEQERYFRDVLDALDHPLALSVHYSAGYITPIPLLQRLCRDYAQLTTINVFGPSSAYFVELRDAVGPVVAICCGIGELLQRVMVGATGYLAAEPNLVPRTSQRVLDRFAAGDLDGAGDEMQFLLRLTTVVNRWAPSTARWVKMGLRVLGLPGGNGVIRRPYLQPPDDQLEQMAAAFRRLGVAEREGLPMPSPWASAP